MPDLPRPDWLACCLLLFADCLLLSTDRERVALMSDRRVSLTSNLSGGRLADWEVATAGAPVNYQKSSGVARASRPCPVSTTRVSGWIGCGT